jgi:chromosome segregation ATPase
MELGQLEKHVQWLDDERRKDKNTIAHLEERLISLEGKLATSEVQATDLSGEITRLRTVMIRMDSFDESLAMQRKEFLKQTKELETQTQQRDDEIMNVLRAEVRTYEAPIYEIRKELEVVGNLKKEMSTRVAEENRLGRLIDELGKNLNELRRSEEEQSRVYRLLEDGRRQDTKRLTDLQGEMVAIRKRSDENRGRVDISDITLRKLETRLNELVTTEQERGNAQAAFQEKQALLAVDREAAWKEWQTRFNTIEKQSIDVENQLQALDATSLIVKRTQVAVDDLMQRVERRINEVAEIQRLAEERFRQEWTTFKADDQKRWTNYTLSQDEQRTEIGRRFERISQRVTIIEDNFQEIRDLLGQVNELNITSLQDLLSTMHEWVDSYQRTRSASR